MAQNNTIDALVSQFVSDLQQAMKRNALEQVLAALQVGDMPARRGPGRPKGAGRGPGRPPAAAKPSKAGGRIRRSPEDLAALSDQLLAHVKANPGQRGEQIAAALKTDVGTIRPTMHKLIAAKQVRTEGQRRGMTYHPGGGGGAPKAKAGGKGKRGKKA